MYQVRAFYPFSLPSPLIIDFLHQKYKFIYMIESLIHLFPFPPRFCGTKKLWQTIWWVRRDNANSFRLRNWKIMLCNWLVGIQWPKLFRVFYRSFGSLFCLLVMLIQSFTCFFFPHYDFWGYIGTPDMYVPCTMW